MKRDGLKYKSLVLAYLFPMIVSCSNNPETPEWMSGDKISKTFREAEGIVPNYGQGFLSSTRFNSTVTYLRMQWEELEPEKGVYNWDRIDNVLKGLDLDKGQSLAIRIMCCSSHSSGKYCTPQWVFDEGAQGKLYVAGDGGGPSGGERIERIDPYYDDPVFMEYHSEFIRELGKRYNGNPSLSVVDIGSYGNWGEWHADFAPPVSNEILKQYVDWYVQAFPDTKMVFMTDGTETLPYALQFGVGLRRDGVGSPKLAQEWAGSDRYKDAPTMGDAWKNAPVIFEWWGNYDYLQSVGWSFEESVDFITSNHASIVNDNIGTVPDDQMPVLNNLAKVLGTRLVLNSIENNSNVNRGDSLVLKFSFSNKGIAKLYQKYVLRITLFDSTGNIVQTVDANADPTTWLPGDYQFVERVFIPLDRAAGNYKIGVGIVDPEGVYPMWNLANTLTARGSSYVVSEFNCR